MNIYDIAQLITQHHQPTPEEIANITAIRHATAHLISTIMEKCPSCSDRSEAVRKAREAMMTANAAIVVPEVKI